MTPCPLLLRRTWRQYDDEMKLEEKKKIESPGPVDFCGAECLRSLFQNEEKIELHKQNAGHDCVRVNGKLYFRIESSAVSPERPCGSYRNSHHQALGRMKAQPVSGFLPVLELCQCTYAVPFMNGRVLFDANTIPDTLRPDQKALLEQQAVMVSWGDFAGWVRELGNALILLHRQGLAHGDVTVFNIMIDNAGHAIWLDLENLNEDTSQMENDGAAFFFHVFFLLLEQLSEMPVDFPDILHKLVRRAMSGDELLTGLTEAMAIPHTLKASDRHRNREMIFQLLSRWGKEVDESGFLRLARPYLLRSAVYFQSDFLWLVNYNMKVMHYEKVGLYDLYRKLCELSETERQRGIFYTVLPKQLTAVQKELDCARANERKSQEMLAEKHSVMVAELAAYRERQKAADAALAILEERCRELQNTLQKEQQQKQAQTQALLQSKSALAVADNDLKHLHEVLQQERHLQCQTADALREAEQKANAQTVQLTILQGEKERLEQEREAARHLWLENDILQQSNAVIRKMVVDLEQELDLVKRESAALREQTSRQEQQIAAWTTERTAVNARMRQLEEDQTKTLDKLQQSLAECTSARNVIAGYEKKFAALQDISERMTRNECELASLRSQKTFAQKQEQQALDLLGATRELTRRFCEHPSFRIAKLLQVLKHPEYAGLPGRCAVIRQLWRSIVSGKPFCREYLALNGLLRFLDDGIRAIHLSEPVNEGEKLLPPDESVLISIILPVYNQANMLGEAIDSVVRQTYRNWELIVLNDGSTDDVDAVMKRYEADPRVHYLVQPNQKLPKALSNAFKYARGELLTWTSADNHMRPEMLARLSAFLRCHPRVDMVYADYAVIDNEGQPFHAAWFRPQNKYTPESAELHLPHNADLLNVVKDNFIGASFMYRRNIRSLLGDYDPQLGVEDYDYWMRINDLGKISHLGTDEILYDYRVHDNSLSGKAREFKILEKSLQLMEYEKERFAFYQQAFEIYGSYQESDLDLGPFQARYVAGIPSDNAGGTAKRVLLLKGSELGDRRDEDFADYDFIAAFFDLNEEPYCGKFASRIRRHHIQCFARPESIAARYLAMFVPNHGECLPGEFGRLALSAANNRLFWNRTRTPMETALVPAEPAAEQHGAIVILLEQLGTGGMEQMAVDMARHFACGKRKVILVCVKDFQASFKAPRGIVFKPLDMRSPEDDFRQLLEREKPDAVIAHYTLWGAEHVHQLKIPFYQVLHNTYIWFSEEQCRNYQENDSFTTAYFAVSATVAWDAVARLSLPPEKIIVWENGIDHGRFFSSDKQRIERRQQLQLRESDILLVNPASCYGAKGQLHLVHAFARIAAQYPHLQLIMSGKILEDHYAEKIRAVIREHHLEKQVRFGDFCSDMNALYNAADAVVMASFWEGCSLAVAEAVRCGCPIVSTLTGDVERQTEDTPRILLELPVRFQTELNSGNIGAYLYEPNPELVEKLRAALEIVAQGGLPRASRVIPDKSAAEVYSGYLRALNLLANGFSSQAVRHNLKGN